MGNWFSPFRRRKKWRTHSGWESENKRDFPILLNSKSSRHSAVSVNLRRPRVWTGKLERSLICFREHTENGTVTAALMKQHVRASFQQIHVHPSCELRNLPGLIFFSIFKLAFEICFAAVVMLFWGVGVSLLTNQKLYRFFVKPALFWTCIFFSAFRSRPSVFGALRRQPSLNDFETTTISVGENAAIRFITSNRCHHIWDWLISIAMGTKLSPLWPHPLSLPNTTPTQVHCMHLFSFNTRVKRFVSQWIFSVLNLCHTCNL